MPARTIGVQGKSSHVTDFDVLITSDLRFPGGTSHSIAEEITAQTRAGYRTGLVHLNGPLVEKLRPVNPLIRRLVLDGSADLLVDRGPVRTSVLVIRHPAVAQTALAQLPPIKARHVVVVANAGPRDIDGREHYHPQHVDQSVREHLGQDPFWAPIGPLVRDAISSQVPAERMLTDDWVNIIDVDAWAVQRTSWASDRPVIGRHSRPSPQKWPADADTIRKVYPVDGSWDVRILGGAEPAAVLLGSVPERWQVKPFGAVPPKEFLADLDFFVYYHDSRWVEAFGRTILEAMASGAVVVLPPHFRALFDDGAQYAEPDQVRDLVNKLRSDRSAYIEQAERASTLVRARFGYEAHDRRLRDLIGPPGATTGSPADPVQIADIDLEVDANGAAELRRAESSGAPGLVRSTRRPEGTPRVLLMSSNGAGMGHLTRLLAYARRLGEEVEPYFLSLSQAVAVVGRYGFRYEYLPSSGALAMPPSVWQELFVSRVREVFTRVRPDVVVFDGTWPYNGIPQLRDEFDSIAWVWSRRGMWRRGKNTEQVRKREWFDQVIEPGDFAFDYDVGATRTDPSERIGPVTLLDRTELQDRAAARAALGLPADRRLGLISLGAGNINDTSSDIGATTAAMRTIGLDACITRTQIAASDVHDDVHVVHDYPLARRYAAFDVVVSASGYNSFQEVLRMGVPNLLVPNPQTALDDQEGRARFASDRGWSHSTVQVNEDTMVPLLQDLLDRGQDMVAGAQQHDPGNGAEPAAQIIAGLAHRRQSV